eukprot:2978399-Amphidinium_carterae.1
MVKFIGVHVGNTLSSLRVYAAAVQAVKVSHRFGAAALQSIPLVFQIVWRSVSSNGRSAAPV